MSGLYHFLYHFLYHQDVTYEGSSRCLMRTLKGNGMIASLQTKPYALLFDEGRRLQSLGVLISVKATSEQTAGAGDRESPRDEIDLRLKAKPHIYLA
jgi:hypothetical protein